MQYLVCDSLVHYLYTIIIVYIYIYSIAMIRCGDKSSTARSRPETWISGFKVTG